MPSINKTEALSAIVNNTVWCMCNSNMKVGHIWVTEFMEKKNKNKNPTKISASETNPRQCVGWAVEKSK